MSTKAKNKVKSKPAAKPSPQPKSSPPKPKTIRHILFKTLFCVLLLALLVRYSDSKGWFEPNNANNHTQRKWDAYYRFAEKNEIDAVIVGNSHVYAGVNPKNLSCALGANCFVLAAPGTTLTDSYYCLKEAIAVCKPKIVIVETFGINDYESYKLNDNEISDQLVSFHARKNFWQKILSMPALFTPANYLPAWSNTIRNHSFIFTDRPQIKANIEAGKKKKLKDDKLYLGRFVAFSTGLVDTTLAKYDVQGATIDGEEIAAGREARKYLKKISDLCLENDIRLMFLTVPMYHRHVSHYDEWKSNLAGDLSPCPWLDLQSPYDTLAYGPACFENTVKANQHLTYLGSVVTAYKLAQFIRNTFPATLPDRSVDTAWMKMFYAEEGFFENYSPRQDDAANRVIFKDTSDNALIHEIDLLEQKDYNVLLIKVNRTTATYEHFEEKKLLLTLGIKKDGQEMLGKVEATADIYHQPLNYCLYMVNTVKDVEIINIINYKLLNLRSHKVGTNF
jgi:hypothetical protein